MSEPLAGAMSRRRRSEGGGTALPPEAMEPYLCEALSVTPRELYEMGYEAVQLHLAWREGAGLGDWASGNPRVKVGQG